MAIQINIPIVTSSGLDVASGSYVWLSEERAADHKYSVFVRLAFFKDKQSFDNGLSRFFPAPIPDSQLSAYAEFSPSAYASLTSIQVHNFIIAQLETYLGVGTMQIVQ